MKRDKESAARIEARLERSLRKQVTAPKLDGRFDAAVWSRIAREDRAARTTSASPAAYTVRMPRWLLACIALGVGVTLVVVSWFAVRQLSGVDLGQELGFDWTRVTADQWQSFLMLTGYSVSAAAVLFGLMFTRFGRRLMSLLR